MRNRSCAFSVLIASVLLIRPVLPIVIEPSVPTGWLSGDEETVVVVEDRPFNLTCSFELQTGEAETNLQWWEYDNGDEIIVFNSDGRTAGALQNDFVGRGTYDFTVSGSMITNTISLDSFTSTTDTSSYNCIVVYTTNSGPSESANEVTTFTVIADADVPDRLELDTDFGFGGGFSDNQTVTQCEDLSLEITATNPDVNGTTDLCPEIIVTINAVEVTCSRTCGASSFTCTIIVDSSDYGNNAAIVTYPRMIDSTGTPLTLYYVPADDCQGAGPPTTHVESTVLSTTLNEGGTTTADPSVLTTESPTPSSTTESSTPIVTTEDLRGSSENNNENDKNEVIIAISVVGGVILVSVVAAAVYIGVRHGGGGSKPVARKPRGTSGTNFHYRSSRSFDDVISSPDYVTPGSAYAHSYAYAQPPADYVMAQSPDGQLYRTQNLGRENYGYRIQPENDYGTRRGAVRGNAYGYSAQRPAYGYTAPANVYYG